MLAVSAFTASSVAVSRLSMAASVAGARGACKRGLGLGEPRRSGRRPARSTATGCGRAAGSRNCVSIPPSRGPSATMGSCERGKPISQSKRTPPALRPHRRTGADLRPRQLRRQPGHRRPPTAQRRRAAARADRVAAAEGGADWRAGSGAGSILGPVSVRGNGFGRGRLLRWGRRRRLSAGPRHNLGRLQLDGRRPAAAHAGIGGGLAFSIGHIGILDDSRWHRAAANGLPPKV